MATIQETERLLKRAILVNLVIPTNKELNITPLLSGAHGVGKTHICKKVASDINGRLLTIEGGSLKEGEITGLPVAMKNDDNESEVNFVPYYQIAKIKALEKEIYNKAREGMLGGKLKLTDDGIVYKSNDGAKVFPVSSKLENV